MNDTPKLPDSPMYVAVPNPRHAVWRSRMLAIASALSLIGALGIGGGSIAFVLFMGWPSSLSDLMEYTSVFALAAPALLPGLVGLQAALRGERLGMAAAIAARVMPAFTLTGCSMLAWEGMGDALHASFAVSGAIASVVVACLPSGRPSRPIAIANCVVLSICATVSGLLIAMAVSEWSLGHWMELAVLALVGILPIPASIAMCALILAEPQGGASDD